MRRVGDTGINHNKGEEKHPCLVASPSSPSTVAIMLKMPERTSAMPPIREGTVRRPILPKA
jgi:hypothetical protein